MILKIHVPPADAAFRSGYVAAWHKEEGDPVEFGDDLCDIAIDHFMALQRTKRAALLGSTSKFRRRNVRSVYDRREGRGVVHMRLTSSEGGVTLGRILVGEGERIDVGQVVAVLSAAGDRIEVDGESLATVPEARVVVNMPDATEIDPFD